MVLLGGTHYLADLFLSEEFANILLLYFQLPYLLFTLLTYGSVTINSCVFSIAGPCTSTTRLTCSTAEVSFYQPISTRRRPAGIPNIDYTTPPHTTQILAPTTPPYQVGRSLIEIFTYSVYLLRPEVLTGGSASQYIGQSAYYLDNSNQSIPLYQLVFFI